MTLFAPTPTTPPCVTAVGPVRPKSDFWIGESLISSTAPGMLVKSGLPLASQQKDKKDRDVNNGVVFGNGPLSHVACC